MEKEKKKHNKILAIALIFGLLLAAMFFFNDDIVSENGENNSVNSRVNINNINDNKEKKDKRLNEEKEHIIFYSYDENKSAPQTVFTELINYGKENDIEIKYNNNYDFGVFIESISKIKNGDNGKYWQYYIDDILGDVAADKKILEEGGSVEWRFEEVPF
ncbi:MAG: DUF4430 domain-containing protein [Candidatus Pacebacteria bacterium]|nr:DUF4430 domain-containing protein [Candidatus Paceibacterota bacterium]